MSKLSKKTLLCFAASIVFFILFAAFTATVMLVDVRAIGPLNSSVGLATINKSVFDTVGQSTVWYEITEILGLIPFVVIGVFAILGLIQAIKRKSVLKVDSAILLLGAFYILLGITFVAFEIVEINFRPILVEGELEASYPSTHTMLASGIMLTAIYVIKELFAKKKPLVIALSIACILLAAIIVVGRLLSGVHWFSDIMAGLLISGALVSLYYAFALYTKDKFKNKV